MLIDGILVTPERVLFSAHVFANLLSNGKVVDFTKYWCKMLRGSGEVRRVVSGFIITTNCNVHLGVAIVSTST